MIKQKNTTILGISLGAKRNGVAIISYGTLIHWRLHSTPGVWSEKKLHCILDRYETYFKKYAVARVFIKVPPLTHHSPAITDLLKQLLQRCHSHGCVVQYDTKANIKVQVPEVQNPQALIQFVALRFPILSVEQKKELHLTFPYQIKMFEAVLVAYLVHKELLFQERK